MNHINCFLYANVHLTCYIEHLKCTACDICELWYGDSDSPSYYLLVLLLLHNYSSICWDVCVSLCSGTAQDWSGFPHFDAVCNCVSLISARSWRVFKLLRLLAAGNCQLQHTQLVALQLTADLCVGHTNCRPHHKITGQTRRDWSGVQNLFGAHDWKMVMEMKLV